MRGPHSPESREKISRAGRERWQNPEYRARMLPHVLSLAPKRGGCPRGFKHSPETIEKIRRASIRQWQDPEYRARGLRVLREASKLGGKVYAERHGGKPKVRPPKGTPRRRLFDKIARELGSAAAHEALR